MFKFVSVILVLVLFFGPVVNSFADEYGEDDGGTSEILIAVGVGVGLLALGIFSVWLIGKEFFSEAETPVNGIRMVSAENEEFEKAEIKTDSKPILNVLQHVEVGVSQDKDIYVGLRFQY
jgi:flagellar basal body-associated protein FliL